MTADRKKNADQFAFQLLEKSRINPSHFAGFMLRLKRKKDSAIDEHLQIISSHPDENSRIEAASQYQLPNDFEEITFDLNWQDIQNPSGQI